MVASITRIQSVQMFFSDEYSDASQFVTHKYRKESSDSVYMLFVLNVQRRARFSLSQR
jgi:hypothetical protein